MFCNVCRCIESTRESLSFLFFVEFFKYAQVKWSTLIALGVNKYVNMSVYAAL